MNKTQITHAQLKMRQQMPLEVKENLSIQRIKTWYDYFQGQVFVSYSGGKDSTVLLHLVRRFYPHVLAVFVNTGLEYPEIIKFVRTTENVIWLRPEMNFKQVIEKYGYPIVSKQQAQYIYEYRTAKSEKTRTKRWNGWIRPDGVNSKRFKISEKWKFLVDAPFKISDKCCNVMKKKPIAKYRKESGTKGYVGVMASDSEGRHLDYRTHGCNAFGKVMQQSRPIMFWTTEDIWNYIRKYNIPYSKIYDMGQKNTGCIYCGFGAAYNNPNRFQIMKKTHPKLWKYCMEKLGMREVLKFWGVPFE